jgi:signal transduction histidine kinase
MRPRLKAEGAASPHDAAANEVADAQGDGPEARTQPALAESEPAPDSPSTGILDHATRDGLSAVGRRLGEHQDPVECYKGGSMDGSSTAPRCLGGGGAAGELARSIDWSRTRLGAVDGWSPALRSAASLVLNNQSGMLLWWGPQFVQIYNDAYRPVLGDKHPRAMGQTFAECWPEVFEFLRPMAERPFLGGPASTSDDLPLLLNRKVPREEAHFRLAYSPVRDESVPETGVGGVLATVTEITEEVFGGRQLRTLRELGASRVSEATTVEEACVAAAQVLRENRDDVPFALFYVAEPGGRRLNLAADVGFKENEVHPAIQRAVDLDDPAPGSWPLGRVVAERRPVILEAPSACGVLPASVWGDPSRSAIALPLASSEQKAAYGVLVCGLSPHRVLDASYRTFFELAAGQVVTAMRSARALEEERGRADALAQIDRAKTAFFSNVSHEFRTPLTLMLGPLEDALNGGHGMLRGASLEAVHRNALRLLKLVNSLLDFSRVEAQRQRPSYQRTDMASLTRDLASAFRSTMERGGLSFEVRCDAVDDPVYVDHDMWEKIVLNLLSNAFKFTLSGGVRVTQRAMGGELWLEVADTGAGIPAEELPRLFERFHRVEGARSRSQEGSGIGLALVHEFVRFHGGRVEVASTLGEGTSISVRVPLGRDHLPAEHVQAATTPTGASAAAEAFVSEALRWIPSRPDAPARDQGAPRVVFADDNADMREYVGHLLGELCRVEVFHDGAEALAAVRASPPDLVLTDVMMPNVDGFAVLSAIRADPRTAPVPVILLSARAGQEARLEGLAKGADDYLVKPFSSKELVARVHAQLTRSSAQRAAGDERLRLRALISQIPAIVNFLRGPELVIEFAHPMTLATFPGRDLVGKPLLEAIPEFADQEYPTLLRRVLETGERIEGRERLLRLKDAAGELRETYWNFIYLPVRDASGAIEGVMTFDLEVTDQVRTRVAAEGASRAKDEFLAMLGHELRNPLSPIGTSLQLLRMRGDVSREHVVIERQVSHLVRLVDDLLDVSRIARGKIELRRMRWELGEVCLRGLEMASPLIEQRRQRVDVHVRPEGLPVDVDADRMAQVVANLLTNASKYSDPGRTIRLVAEGSGSRVRFSVRDEGVGIAAEALGHVFDVFFQQKQSLDRSKGGLGLGLAIVRSLVELHGGTVFACSDGPGKGSEFVVELPKALGREDTTCLTEKPEGVDSSALAARPGKRILIVDDNVDAAESLAEVLTDMGYEVATAEDGPQALELVPRFRPEVCLLDIGLPVMDGYELAERLRDSFPEHGRLIAVTGYGQAKDRERSSKAGFSGHLVKPVDLDELTRLVEFVN